MSMLPAGVVTVCFAVEVPSPAPSSTVTVLSAWLVTDEVELAIAVEVAGNEEPGLIADVNGLALVKVPSPLPRKMTTAFPVRAAWASVGVGTVKTTAEALSATAARRTKSRQAARRE